MVASSGVQEFYEITKTLEERKRIARFAIADRLLWKREGNGSAKFPVHVYSLSPSDKSVVLSNLEIAGLIPLEKIPKKRLIPQRPNNTAVVLWIEVNDGAVLLGSDLENLADEQRGWLAILDSSTKPAG